MDTENLIRRLMMPVEDFAVVPVEATVEEALRALRAAQLRVPEGRQPHRSVLVRDNTGYIIGKVGQRALLRAFVPQTRELFDHQMLRQAGVSSEMMEISMSNLELLHQNTEELRQRAAYHTVGELIVNDPEQIEVDTPLSDVIRAFVDHDILSVLVLEKDTLVGVLRLTDLFSTLTEVVVGSDHG